MRRNHKRRFYVLLGLWLFMLGLIIGSVAFRPAQASVEAPVVQNHLPMAAKKTVWIEVKGDETREEAVIRQNRTTPVIDKVSKTQKVVHSPVPAKTSSELLPVASKVCEKVGLPTDPCARDLVAMAWKESRFNVNAVGDNNRSFSWFQIQTKLHKVTLDCAKDFMCAAEWTAKHLIKHGYGDGMRSYALSRHNGAGPAARKYAESVKAYSLAMIN